MYVDLKSFHASARETTPPFSLIGHAEFIALFEAGRVNHYLERQRGDLYIAGNIDMLIAERDEGAPVTSALTRHFQRIYTPKKAAAYLNHMAGPSAEEVTVNRALGDADYLYSQISQPYVWGDTPHMLVSTHDGQGHENFCCVLWEPEKFQSALDTAKAPLGLKRTLG